MPTATRAGVRCWAARQRAGSSSRIPIVIARIIFPYSSSIPIGAMPATDQAGFAGLHDQMDTNVWEKFGNALILVIGSAGIFMLAGLLLGIVHDRRLTGPGRVAPVPGATYALIMAEAAARKTQSGMFAGLPPREGAFVTLFAALAWAASISFVTANDRAIARSRVESQDLLLSQSKGGRHIAPQRH